MVEFTAVIQKFEERGDKTGWSYIEIPADIAQELFPGNKKSFKIKGRLDQYKIKGKNLLPMGGGAFILALDATVRKNIHKNHGAMLTVQLEKDSTPFIVPDWLLECLEDEPKAKERFFSLPKSHQKYYIDWINGAKTEQTRTKRIAQAVNSFLMGTSFGEMIRMNRDMKDI